MIGFFSWASYDIRFIYQETRTLEVVMENPTRTGVHEFNLASRKAEEAAWRRFQASEWLESLVGPLGISNQPSEREFISCLRNGLFLCNAINKIQPGIVPKVVENHCTLQTLTRDSQPLPAYQYFENVRNFLVAVEELKLPAFEASDIERDTLEAGSVGKVVDCILALKSYHEWKLMTGGNGDFKHGRSPMVLRSGASRVQPSSTGIPSGSCRRLDLSAVCEKQSSVEDKTQKVEELFVRALAERMLDAKENIDDNLLASFHNGNLVPVKLFSKIMSSCLDEQLQSKFPDLTLIFKDHLREGSGYHSNSASPPPEDSNTQSNPKCCRSCSKKGCCSHRRLFQMQEKELLDLKHLLSTTKRDFEDLQSLLQSDLKQLGSWVLELSTAAVSYQRVVKENRTLYNMVQDLKGNIRVYCRIRPAFRAEARSVIDFIGDDGTLVIVDPLKPQKEGRKVFQFNRVFGPTANQDEVFKDTQPLIRSVMDGYNVCIFAYGQTGSGKTHTMCGPSGGLTKEMGINYLALKDLFQLSDTRKQIVNYDIRVQMVEIYNEQVRDLLAEDSSATKLEIRSCTGDNGLNLPDATMHSVKTTSDVLNLMKLGEVNRVVSSTAINNRSSRSHSVLTVHVHGKDTSGNILRSCLHLVDLAGSERVDKSEVTGDRLKEAQYINKSLSCLGDVITALAQKNSHIPYRNSKLTLLLQDSLGGHAKTLMFAHVSPEGDSFAETVGTLKFAQRVSTVELGAARLNKESNEVMELKQQVESLKKALANKEPQSIKPITPKELRATTERTPPHPRRLSIENSSAAKTEKMNSESRKGSKTPPPLPTRSRRLSLEGSKHGKKDHHAQQIKPEYVSKPLPFEIMSIQNYSQLQDAESISKSHGHFSNSGSVSHKAPPKSPMNSAYKSRVGTKITPLQIPKSPESSTHSTESRTSSLISSTVGKESQIKRSLRSIGKLINGSEKRNRRNPREALSPIRGAISEVKSPPTANERALRRQSLTGIQSSVSSRRSSLGGKSTDSYTNGSRNAKTPPPVTSSSKTMKQWL